MVAVLAVSTLAPAFASAAQLTARSIVLSSSSAEATGVSYTVNFTAIAGAGAFVVDFCSNSPVVGDTCTAPAGFNASTAASTTTNFTDVTGSTSKVVVAGTIAGGDAVSVALTGITNPTAAAPIYARIVTFDTKTHAQAYTSTALGTGATDNGGVAISITDTVAFAGTVMETMTFCVSKNAIDHDCTNVVAPVLSLGEPVGDTLALVSTAISTGVIHTQISTNAATGAIISLKSNTTSCGGMVRAGSPGACDIKPALASDIAVGQAKFGVKTGTVTDSTGVTGSGTLEPVAASGYNNTTYALNYVDGNGTGVTSTYGDPFLDTNNLPINNKNMDLTFGASVTNSTPAGLYSADLSLLATGKF